MINLKNLFLQIVGFICTYFSLVFLTKSQESYIWIIGVLLLYFGIYSIVESFINSLLIERKNNLLPIFLKVCIPFYSLKVISKHIYKSNKYYLLGIGISTILILLFELKINRKNYSKETINLDNFQSFTISLFPFYFFKTGSVKALHFLVLITLIKKFYIKEKLRFDKEFKIISILLCSLMLFLGLSFLGNEVGKKGLTSIKVISIWVFFALLLLQANPKAINIKNIILSSVNSVIIFYLPFFIKWMNVNYRIENIRLGTFIDITQTGVILGLLQILFGYYLFSEKKIEILSFYILNFVFLILTGSKGPLLLTLFLSAIIVFLLLQKKQKIGFLIMYLILVVLLFKSDLSAIKRLKIDDGSSTARKLIYRESFNQFLQKPLLGNGQGTYLELATKNNEKKLEELLANPAKLNDYYVANFAYKHIWYTHSNILELLSGSGIFAFLSYYLFIGFIFVKNLRYYLSDKKNKIFLIGLICLTYFEIYGIIDNVIIYERLQMINIYIAILFYISRKEVLDVKEMEKRTS